MGVAEITATGLLLAVTVTLLVAVLPPSSVLTVMAAEPAATPDTTPTALTVATEVLLEDQFTFLLVALAGDTVADKVVVFPLLRVSEVGETLTLETATEVLVTFTVAVAVLAPSCVVTVMVAEPVA